jgi:hypothetical protein
MDCQPVPDLLPAPRQEAAAPVAAVEQQQPVGGAHEQVRPAVAAPVAGREQRREAAPAGPDRQPAAGRERAGARAAVHEQLAGGVDGEHVGPLVAAPVRARRRRAGAQAERRREEGG